MILHVWICVKLKWVFIVVSTLITMMQDVRDLIEDIQCSCRTQNWPLLSQKLVLSKTMKIKIPKMWYPLFVSTVCPPRYWTQHFFNNFTTNEDIATKFEGDLQTHSSSFLTQWTCPCSNFVAMCIGVKIIIEMPGLVASGTHCMSEILCVWWKFVDCFWERGTEENTGTWTWGCSRNEAERKLHNA
jgi:hypothetical protein